MKHLLDLFVPWSVFIVVGKHFLGEGGQNGGFATANITDSLVFPCFLCAFEGLNTRHLDIKINSGDFSVVDHIHKHVEQGDQVVSAAGGLKAQLVQTSKDDVASESLNVGLWQVLAGLLVCVAAGKTEVNNVD